MKSFLAYLLLILITACFGSFAPQSDSQKMFGQQLKKLRARRAGPCSESGMCLSQWGFCGYGSAYCGTGCQGGPCSGTTTASNGNSGSNDIINLTTFQCAFNNLDAATRSQRLTGLQQSGWKPQNKDEAAVFLAHVYHETGGLQMLVESCAPNCDVRYSQTQSWCPNIAPVAGKSYYGRGWFQLSYTCNYHGAGQSLGLNLLANPDLVSQDQRVAVKTAIWFYETNNMAIPARQGDFAATTRKINGPVECDGGPGTLHQQTRVNTYKRIRLCFGLGAPVKNPTC